MICVQKTLEQAIDVNGSVDICKMSGIWNDFAMTFWGVPTDIIRNLSPPHTILRSGYGEHGHSERGNVVSGVVGVGRCSHGGVWVGRAAQ